MIELGVLKKTDLRLVWPKEAHSFTPWLAKNLAHLGEVLGMDLELQLQEAPVGAFSLDLLARDLGSDRTVVIENQLEQTDHDHLGKLLTYAAGHDASVAIWIAPDFREEHRQALDWLNQRTDTHTEFFGVVVEALQIDDSRPACNFRLVAFPNNWRKEKIAAQSTNPSQRGEAYLAFFQRLIDRLRTEHGFTQALKGQPHNWYSFSSGITGIVYGVSFAQKARVRAEVYIDRQDVEWNKNLFDALFAQREALEAQVGDPLTWERLNDRRASRVVAYRDGSITDSPEVLADVSDWAIQRLLRLKAVFNPAVSAWVPITSQAT